jgi:hypothetical protein
MLEDSKVQALVSRKRAVKGTSVLARNRALRANSHASMQLDRNLGGMAGLRGV